MQNDSENPRNEGYSAETSPPLSKPGPGKGPATGPSTTLGPRPMSVARFHVRFVSREPPGNRRLDELISWCVRFNEYGLTPPKGDGTGRTVGNLSFRIAPGQPALVITASALSSKQAPRARDFVKVLDCDLANNTVVAVGLRDPSSESMMHHEIYRRRKEVGAIFHGHDREIVAHAVALDLPVTGTEQPPGTVALLEEAMKVLGKNDFLVLKNHGFLALARTMAEAGALALRIKKQVDKLK